MPSNDGIYGHYILASLRGFEPPTYRLGGDCSIQLSYKDIQINFKLKTP